MRARTPAVVAIAVALLAGCTSSAPPRAPTRTAQVVPPTGVAKSPADWSKLRTFEVLTQYSPSSTFQSQATDLNRIAQSFTGILLASGSLGPSREQAVQLSSTLGLHVWLDLDLTADYAKGVSLTSTLEPLAAFAQQHRDVVVGVKLANELGQVDPYAHDPKLLEGYLRAVSSVLRAKAPGLPLTVDMPIPEAVCAQGSPGLAALGGETACRQTVLDRFPALAQVNVDHYLSLGLLDGVFVTPYLRQDEIYQAAGTDTADVLKFSYRWLKQRPWASQVRLFSRKALAFPDDRYRGTTGGSEACHRAPPAGSLRGEPFRHRHLGVAPPLPRPVANPDRQRRADQRVMGWARGVSATTAGQQAWNNWRAYAAASSCECSESLTSNR